MIPCPVALRQRLVRVGQQADAPDLLVRGGALWNVFTAEVLEGDVAVCGDRIAWAGPGRWEGPVDGATAVIDGRGLVAVPGYLEPHTHPWPFANPLSLGEGAVRRGTTCLVYDDLLLHLALGRERLKALTRALCEVSLPHLFWVARMASQSRFAGEEQFFSEEAVADLLARPEFLAVGEMTRWPDLLDEATSGRLLSVIEQARAAGRFADGHTAGASPKRLPALAATGLRSCHEAISCQDALDRLRLGFWVLLRNSSLRPDLETLLPVLENRAFAHRFVYTTDGAKAHHLAEVGFTDHLIRTVLRAGLPPEVAYRPATLNAAAYLGLDQDLGAVAPGRLAGFNLLENLENPTPKLVVCRGRVAAVDGRLTVDAPSESFDWAGHYAGGEPPVPHWPADLFLFPSGAPNPFPCGDLANAVITREVPIELTRRGPGWWPLRDDVFVLALTDRGGQWLTRGAVSSFASGLRAVASTYTTNGGLLTLGRSPEAMAQALAHLRKLGGGLVTVRENGTVGEYPLPLAGIQRPGGFDDAAEAARAFQQDMLAGGYPHSDANYSLLFFSCDFLPDLRATQAGWVRVKTGEVVCAAQQGEWLKT